MIEGDYADLKPEPVRYISFDAGTPQGQRRHRRHPLSEENRRVQLADIIALIDDLDRETRERT